MTSSTHNDNYFENRLVRLEVINENIGSTLIRIEKRIDKLEEDLDRKIDRLDEKVEMNVNSLHEKIDRTFNILNNKMERQFYWIMGSILVPILLRYLHVMQ